MGVLVDTNVLLRRIQSAHPHHKAAFESVVRLLTDGEAVYFSPQVVAEFWNVLTRPEAGNGLGLTPAAASREVEKIERALTLLPDTPAVYPEWKRLVKLHAVAGVRVHDARLVAVMNVHGVPHILTFNGADFRRYGVGVVEPLAEAG